MLHASDIRDAAGPIGHLLTDRDLQELEVLLLPGKIAARVRLLDNDPNHPVEGGCIEWTGTVTGSIGYGQVRWKGRLEYTHRVALMGVHGELPPGMVGRHRCDRPTCVRLSHLILGTHAENYQDYAERGPSPYVRRGA